MLKLTNLEHHLLDWLEREGASYYGECKGHNFDVLRSAGFVELQEGDPRGLDWATVKLTELGRVELGRIGAWVPGKLL